MTFDQFRRRRPSAATIPPFPTPRLPGSSARFLAPLALLLASCGTPENESHPDSASAAAATARLVDDASGKDWPAYGRTYGEQHYSPLAEISTDSVDRLGLAWSMDLEQGNSVSAPLAIDGTLYVTTGYSIVRAIEAATGKLLWTFDPKAAEAAGIRLRQGWGSRGIAWWNDKIYTGTQDGRLIAIDAGTGKEIWSAMTLEDGDYRFISGAPRVFDGKIIVGHGGADGGATRGYVTAYDAETGKQLWRFYTVPGNPADGFENEAMEVAAKTWSGQWWLNGGGGTVWNAITYDRDTETIFIGTGNGAPWNHRVRSPGGGDNLFLCAIVALDARTGEYKWHYQVNPGESWDYNAAMDMHLADLAIDGQPRKVLIQAPKNGFLYVIDRLTGKLISAEKIAKVTWAEKIDLETGRPVEIPAARYPDGMTYEIWPSNSGAHSWQPSAFSPQTNLVYVPVRETGISFSDAGIDPQTWRFTPGNIGNLAVHLGMQPVKDPLNNTSALLAWDPVSQKAAWKIPTPGAWNGGVMATGGGLVFQGLADSKFNAHDARNGKLLWSFAAQAPILAPPITYEADGRQYVTVLTGAGTSSGIDPAQLPFSIDYRTQARRVLTFALDGQESLPQSQPFVLQPVADPDFRPDAAAADRGAALFIRCLACHGMGAVASGAAPDLRASMVPLSDEIFNQIVRGGMLVPQGMPAFAELNDTEVADLRQYIRTEAARARK